MWAQEAQEEQAALLLATKGIVGIQAKASKNTEIQTPASSSSDSPVHLLPQVFLSDPIPLLCFPSHILALIV